MDTSRLSIARLLELDVPFEWQDAVAVVQEVAMLSDVHAAMYNRPSLVSPEHCYITRAGSVELPETTETESPEAVPDLLRAMLAGREAPEALEDLAFGMATRDMSGALAEFPIGNRRAVIAKLATRALGAVSGPSTAAFTAPDRPAPAGPSLGAPPIAPPTAAESGAWPQPASAAPVPSMPTERPLPVTAPVHALEAAALARETFRPVLVPPPARPPFVAEPAPARGVVQQRPPFVATPPVTAGPPSPARTDATPTASERELERIRIRAAARERAGRRWRERLGALVTWRPSFPDPLVLGGSAIVIAAILSVVWSSNVSRPATPSPAALDLSAASASASAPARVTVPATPSPTTTGGPTPGSAAAAAAAALAAAPATSVASLPAPAARPRRTDATATSASTVSEAPLRIALPSASRPPALDFTAAPAPAATGGVPVTVPADASATAAAGVPALDRAAGSVVSAAPPTGPSSVARDPDAPAGALYTSGDDGVLPPVIRRQHLPSNLLEPMTEVPDDWPYLELLIDARGAVEQVRLHARQLLPGQTLYRHRMLLAAAKAWQFEPARRNGEAVRYLMRVPLEP